MSMTNLDLPLRREDRIFAELRRAGWKGNVQSLRLLAHKGEEYRRRNEASCNYVWATTDHYEAGTDRLAREIGTMAQGFGLCLYLQGDPRGDPVYVSTEPLSDTDYSGHGFALAWDD
jgi:hypothetical protein